jgi:type VI secretion system secreted protein VgrG
MNLSDALTALTGLAAGNRPVRLRLWNEQGFVDDLLLVKQVSGVESIFGGIEYRLLCVATNSDLALKQFMAMPAELQFTTSTGGLRSVCGIVDGAEEGEADGGLATYQLIVRDALTINEKACSTRIFRDMNEVEITNLVLGGWPRANPVLARAFNFEIWRVKSDYPRREFTMQYKESDAAFLRRLWKRRGLAWFFQPTASKGANDAPSHTLVLFDDAGSLVQNAAGSVRYHRDDGTESADSITAWHAVRALMPGSVTRQSWDYKTAKMMRATSSNYGDQGALGNQLAAGLNDSLIDVQHAGDDAADYDSLAKLRMLHHEFNAKCIRGEGGLRDACPGQWMAVTGHAGIDSHPASEREFVITELRVYAENNLPKTLHERANRLFALNRWSTQGDATAVAGLAQASKERDGRYTAQFTCVRRGIPIVPSFDPRVDLPRTEDQTVVVIGPDGESVYCDELGRVRVRFPGCRPEERAGSSAPANGVTEHDSAWVLVSTGWAGARFGVISLPRVGTYCVVSFLGGDPDKPIITNAAHSGVTPPPSFSHVSSLPGDRYLSGIVSQEVNGSRANQLRIDDTPGQISAQLSSDHAATQLNLGFLTHPRSDGRADPRGEGAELRSDSVVAIRGGQGVFISADARLRAAGRQLDRDGLNGLAEALSNIQKQLAELADTHSVGSTDGKPLSQLAAHLKQWENGSNAEGATPDANGRLPIVAIDAPAGMILGSQNNVTIGAQTHVDIISAGNTQLSTGRKLLLHAMDCISIFAHKLGMKLIAANGKVEIQAHQDSIELTAAKRIVLSASEEIIIQAPKVTIISQGAQAAYGGGAITYQCTGTYAVKSASVAYASPGDGALPPLNLPKSEVSHDQHVRMTDLNTGEALENQRYRVTQEDGQAMEGVTDAKGMTQILKSSIPFGRYTIEAIYD